MEQLLGNVSNTNMSGESVRKVLRAVNIKPTNQRIDIAKFILIKDQHLSAEDIFLSFNDNKHGISRATVYNTLNLFADKGLVRRVIIDSSKIYYDSKITPHSHYYNVDTGEIIDFEFNDAQISQLPTLPEHTVQEGIDIVVRIKNLK